MKSHELAVTQLVPRSIYDLSHEKLEPVWRANALEAMKYKGEVVTDLTLAVEFQNKIDGIWMPQIFEGVELPEMVYIKYTADVIPNEESMKELAVESMG